MSPAITTLTLVSFGLDLRTEPAIVASRTSIHRIYGVAVQTVFLLEALEGRMFRPPAFTRTFAMVAASILSITLVPVLMTVFIRGGRLKPESQNPISRFFAWRWL